VLDAENQGQREETMSAPQPPTNGDQPTSGTEATDGSAPTPAETPAPRPARTVAPKTSAGKAAPRKAAPRKTTPGTAATRKVATTPTTTAETAKIPKAEAKGKSSVSAQPAETAETQVLPVAEPGDVRADEPTEILAAVPVASAPTPQSAASEAAAPESVTPEPVAEAVPPVTEPAPEAPPVSSRSSTTEPPAAHQAAPPARTITEVFADRLDNDGFFSALFDFTFTRYVTRKLAGPVYVVGLVLIGLSTILALIYWLGQAIATQSFLGAFVFLFGLIITVVGSALAILLLRVAIEVFVAVVAIAENTRPRRKQGP
jgi:hypothetical protein